MYSHFFRETGFPQVSNSGPTHQRFIFAGLQYSDGHTMYELSFPLLNQTEAFTGDGLPYFRHKFGN